MLLHARVRLYVRPDSQSYSEHKPMIKRRSKSDSEEQIPAAKKNPPLDRDGRSHDQTELHGGNKTCVVRGGTRVCTAQH